MNTIGKKKKSNARGSSSKSCFGRQSASKNNLRRHKKKRKHILRNSSGYACFSVWPNKKNWNKWPEKRKE